MATPTAPKVIHLYTFDVPNNKPGADKEVTEVLNHRGLKVIRNVRYPALTFYLPAQTKSPTPAVLTCPGGSYSCVVFDHEGKKPALALQKAGIAAVILKYRLSNDKIMEDRTIGALQDAQQAMKILKTRVKDWNIDP